MNIFIKTVFTTVIALMVAMYAQAQIPERVKEIMQKCSEKMDNPAGLETDMKLHIGMVIMSMNGSIKMYSKGNKARSTMSMKMFGRELKVETGFDGENEWEYKQALGKGEKDSLIIKKASEKTKGEYDLDLDLADEYEKAELKEKGQFYVITFTKPKKEKDPKKTIIKINKENYYFQEMEAKDSPTTITITAQKFKVGVSDDIFVCDPKQFPGAVVVRK